eukprot:SAG31_NODE_10957_length_1079_cov_0.907143_2_plen_121_part_00
MYELVGKQIKSLNPSTKIIAYFHSNKAMPWYNVSRVANNTDVCFNGDAMNETTCVNSGSPEYAPFFDFRKSAGRKAYADGCLHMTKTGAVDGATHPFVMCLPAAHAVPCALCQVALLTVV